MLKDSSFSTFPEYGLIKTSQQCHKFPAMIRGLSDLEQQERHNYTLVLPLFPKSKPYNLQECSSKFQI